jgi:hypothetical protein
MAVQSPSGESGIRTLGGFTLSGFQGQCIRPLCQLSKSTPGVPTSRELHHAAQGSRPGFHRQPPGSSRRRESNPRLRFCRPLPCHSATSTDRAAGLHPHGVGNIGMSNVTTTSTVPMSRTLSRCLHPSVRRVVGCYTSRTPPRGLAGCVPVTLCVGIT